MATRYCWPSIFFVVSWSNTSSRSKSCIAKRLPGWPPTSGPATCASCRTSCCGNFLLADSDTIHVSFPDRGAANHGATALAVAENTFKTAKARAVAEFERVYLDRILTKTSGNIAMAARIAGTDRSALNKLVKKHGFAGEQFRRPSS